MKPHWSIKFLILGTQGLAGSTFAVEPICLQQKQKQKINLEHFFSKPKNQGDFGSCYLFTATALLEAALNKESRSKVPIAISEFSIFRDSIVKMPPDEIQRFIEAEKRKSLDNPSPIFEGGSVVEVLKKLTANSAIYEPVKLTTSYLSPKDGKKIDLEISDSEAIESLSRSISMSIKSNDSFSSKNLNSYFTSDSLYSAKSKAYPIHEIKVHTILAPYNGVNNSKTRKLGDRLRILKELKRLGSKPEKQDAKKYRQQLLDELSVSNILLQRPKEDFEDTLRQCSEESKELQNKIIEMLCRDIPVGIGMNVAGVEFGGDLSKLTPLESGGQHAMVIQGIERSSSGELFWIFRNSWGHSTSKGRLPVAETCRFSSITAVEASFSKSQLLPEVQSEKH